MSGPPATTEWTARQSKDRMLCGRQDDDGRYVCTGCVGDIRDVKGFERQIVLPDGWVKDEKGYWRLTSRARKRLQDPRGLRSPGVRRPGGDGPRGPRRSSYVVMAPTRVQCPHCDELNTLLPLWLGAMLEA